MIQSLEWFKVLALLFLFHFISFLFISLHQITSKSKNIDTKELSSYSIFIRAPGRGVNFVVMVVLRSDLHAKKLMKLTIKFSYVAFESA